MNKKVAFPLALALSAALLAALTGCITVNVSKDDGNDNAEKSANIENSNAGNANSEADSDANANASSNSSSKPEANTDENGNGNSNAAQNDNAGKDASKNANKNSNANSNTAAKEWSDDFPEPKDAVQQVGIANRTGTIEVPEDWMDRTSQDFRPEQIDSSSVTYVVDPTTEYTSPTFEHFAFSTSIKLEAFPTGYASKAQEYQDKYNKDTEKYSDVSLSNYTLDGHNVALVRTELPEDGDVVMYNVCVDCRDDGHSCATATVLAMDKDAKYILGYLNTWAF